MRGRRPHGAQRGTTARRSVSVRGPDGAGRMARCGAGPAAGRGTMAPWAPSRPATTGPRSATSAGGHLSWARPSRTSSRPSTTPSAASSRGWCSTSGPAPARWRERRRRAGRATRVTAIDGSRAMLEVGRREAERTLVAEVAGRIVWQTGLAQALPFADGSFDLALSSFVMQLVPDRPAALREAGRVLRPGGRLALRDLARRRPAVRAGGGLRGAGGRGRARRCGRGRGAPQRRYPVARRPPPRSSAGPASASVTARAGLLEHRWTPRTYLEFLERYDAADLFGSLAPEAAGASSDRTAERLAALPRDRLRLAGRDRHRDRPATCLSDSRPGSGLGVGRLALGRLGVRPRQPPRLRPRPRPPPVRPRPPRRAAERPWRRPRRGRSARWHRSGSTRSATLSTASKSTRRSMGNAIDCGQVVGQRPDLDRLEDLEQRAALLVDGWRTPTGTSGTSTVSSSVIRTTNRSTWSGRLGQPVDLDRRGRGPAGPSCRRPTRSTRAWTRRDGAGAGRTRGRRRVTSSLAVPWP